MDLKSKNMIKRFSYLLDRSYTNFSSVSLFFKHSCLVLRRKTIKKTDKMKKPQIEDFYDELDPRGISSTEYNNYLEALEEYERSTRGNLVREQKTKKENVLLIGLSRFR